MALIIEAGHLHQTTKIQADVATVKFTNVYLIVAHTTDSIITLPTTISHGKKIKRIGASGCETKAGRAAHSIARRCNILSTSASDHCGFIFRLPFPTLVTRGLYDTLAAY